MTRFYNRLAATSLIALIALGLAWELWLAPLREGGSLLALKVLPLLLPLFGILRGKRYTHQWTPLLALLFLLEGLTRTVSDSGPSRLLAFGESVLTILLLTGCLGYARAVAPSRAVRSAD